ncbi:MAG: flavodoxin family protein [Desulfobacterota bacterium]|nr:flavodoxin family protein [Thermodesulfobacteriota bacterium]
MHITAIYGSPRKGGNTDLLMEACLHGVHAGGQSVHEIFLRDLHFSPCIECGGCATTGICVLRDDMDLIYPHLTSSACIIVSAPVFFYGLNAHTKAMIDRTQCLWVKKYLLQQPVRIPPFSEGHGVLLSTGGSRGKKNFDGILLTMKYFYDALDMKLTRYLTFHGIDECGAVTTHPTALDDAFNLGKEISASIESLKGVVP